MTKKPDISKMSFEEALKELETIVRTLESGDTALEDAITHYTRGARLKQHCEQKLQDATLKVEQILVNADGEITTQPFEA
jgi:exodeoxyribonuclease VII small subunit